jgi:hypothetical protein
MAAVSSAASWSGIVMPSDAAPLSISSRYLALASGLAPISLGISSVIRTPIPVPAPLSSVICPNRGGDDGQAAKCRQRLGWLVVVDQGVRALEEGNALAEQVEGKDARDGLACVRPAGGGRINHWHHGREHLARLRFRRGFDEPVLFAHLDGYLTVLEPAMDLEPVRAGS